jgi:hypothetical protein
MRELTCRWMILICAGVLIAGLMGCNVPLAVDELAANGGLTPQDTGIGSNPSPGDPAGGGSDGGQGSLDPSGNAAPTVAAGPDLTAREGFPVRLLAVADDDDGDPLTLEWEQLGGAPVVLTLVDESTAEFDAPFVDTANEASLVFTVTVWDDVGGVADDTVNVRVILAGDVDMNDVVDEADQLRVEELFAAGGTPGPGGEGDLNGDGRVDGRDLSIVIGDLGRAL